MAHVEAATRAFIESQGHAWPAAPDPLLLLDGPLRRCSEALGRVVVEPDYFHTVAHVKVLADEVRKLERAGVTTRFNANRMQVMGFYDSSVGVLKETEKLSIVSGTLTAPPTDADVHIRAILERPKRDALRFNVMWRRAFGHDWPYAADRAIHPWLQTAYDAQVQFYNKWRLPAGTQNGKK